MEKPQEPGPRAVISAVFLYSPMRNEKMDPVANRVRGRPRSGIEQVDRANCTRIKAQENRPQPARPNSTVSRATAADQGRARRTVIQKAQGHGKTQEVRHVCP